MGFNDNSNNEISVKLLTAIFLSMTNHIRTMSAKVIAAVMIIPLMKILQAAARLLILSSPLRQRLSAQRGWSL